MRRQSRTVHTIDQEEAAATAEQKKLLQHTGPLPYKQGDHSYIRVKESCSNTKATGPLPHKQGEHSYS